MTQLVKGMYGHEFSPTRNAPFGLMCGQMRARSSFGHNAGWYNKKGEKLGFGDLNGKDIQNIQNGLEQDELFIILSELASFWKFVRRPGAVGSMADVDRQKEYEPGQEYVSKHFMYCVTKEKVFRSVYDPKNLNPSDFDGITVYPLAKEKLYEMMKLKKWEDSTRYGEQND